MSGSSPGFQKNQYERPTQCWIETPVENAVLDSEPVLVRRRSLRSKRNTFTISVTVFTIGTLLILFNSPFRNEFVVPGSLVSSHAQILAGQGADRCAACHDAAELSFSSWVKDAFTGGSVASKCQSEFCMKCHEKSISREFALNPHNVDPSVLRKRTSQFKHVSFDARMAFKAPVNANNELACSTCHREHHGTSDLSALTDQQCQTCHVENYHSFETDHPEFTTWPVLRRARIAFDHSSHSLKHFPDKKKQFDCTQCHIDDGHKNVKLLASYQKSCSQCHQEQILESGRDGLAIFALPMLDLEAIQNAGQDIGSWPENATGDFDGKLPPIMRLLLTADEQVAELLAQSGSDFDLADIDPTDSESVLNACKVVWSIKYLLHDLSVQGSAAIRKRLETALDKNVTPVELARLTAELNEPIFQDAVRRWLPGLNLEVTQHRWGVNTKIGWLPDEILAYQDTDTDEQLAPNPLLGLIEPLGGAPEREVPMPVIKHAPDTQSHNATDGVLPMQTVIQNQHVDPANDPALLAINPLRDRMKSKLKTDDSSPVLPQVTNAPTPSQGLLSQNNNEPKAALKTPPEGKLPNQAASSNPAVEIIRGAVPVVAKGGWFRDDSIFQVSYRPGGHADPCIQSWTDLIASLPDANVRVETSELFKQLTNVNGIGLCRSCHTVDQLDDDSFQVNWIPEYRDITRRGFTRFAHGPHLIQPLLQNCTHCHELDETLSNSQSFVEFDPSNAMSNFKPVKKSNCSNCHHKDRTNNGCTQCHNYHVGSQVIGN